MAAGLGFKDFTTGEVLTAADVDGYLMQGVWVFASAAARDAAVTSPQEGNFAYLKDTNVTTYYTGSAWANLDTTGMTNPMTTTGDMIYSSSGSTPARLGIGTAGQVLKVNSGATAPEWGAAAAGGAVGAGASVLTSQSTTSGTYTDLATVGPSVTVTTGTKAMVIIGAYTGGNDSYDSYMSYAVSGATTVAANNNWAMSLLDAAKQSQSYATIQTGLTAGSNTFTAKYRADGGASLSWANRYILVIDLGS